MAKQLEDLDLDAIETFDAFPEGVCLPPRTCPLCGVRPAIFFFGYAGKWLRICPECTARLFPDRRIGTIYHASQESSMPDRHPAVAGVLQFFAYAHLPDPLQAVSRRFAELATTIADGPQNAEATVALRKLLEAKDAAVRAHLFKSGQ